LEYLSINYILIFRETETEREKEREREREREGERDDISTQRSIPKYKYDKEQIMTVILFN